jgi:hypothetical protein
LQEGQENHEDHEDQEYQKYQNFKISKYQKYQEIRVQSTKTLSYSHHQSRFEDIHQQEYQAQNLSAKVKHEDQNFQVCIGDNHGRS